MTTSAGRLARPLSALVTAALLTLSSAPPASASNAPCTVYTVVYTYDANGNRLSQTITVSGGPTAPTWGTAVWGCFTWTPQ
jgi:hypothetical protein